MPNHSKLQRATKRHDKLRRNWCRRCRFRAPSGQCLDTTLRSGRCGDWVYYLLRGNKQFRRRWVRPKDPRTPAQLQSRARLRVASRHYSSRLTDEERDACIAAGAKRQSRPRLGQSGALSGQLYSVRNAYAKKMAAKVQSTNIPAQVPRPQKVTRPTWETRRGGSVVTPGQRARRSGVTGRGRKAVAASEVLKRKGLTRRTREHYRNGSGVVPVQRRRGTRFSRVVRALVMRRTGVRLSRIHVIGRSVPPHPGPKHCWFLHASSEGGRCERVMSISTSLMTIFSTRHSTILRLSSVGSLGQRS